MAEAFTTLGQSTLNGAISSTSSTSIPVTSGTTFPSSGTFRVRVDNEIMKVTANSGNTFTVVRADGGTTAATHASLATITQVVTAEALAAFQLDTLGLAVQGSIPGGRLTLVSGTAFSTTDISGAPTVYYTPHINNVVALWDGSYWQRYTFSELSLAIGTITSALPYDVFLYVSSGSVAIEKLAWTSALVRATGISIQDGRYCKTGDKTRLYVGSFVGSSTTTTEDSEAKPFLFNAYHQMPRRHRGSGVYATNTSSLSSSYAVVAAALDTSIFVGVAQAVDVAVSLPIYNAGGSLALESYLGLRVDGLTDYDMVAFANDSGGSTPPLRTSRSIPLSAGLHSLSMVWKIGSGSGSVGYLGASRATASDASAAHISCLVVR